jgi:flagellar basal-body rod protein FlgB
MFDSLEVMRMAHGLAQHASTRQSAVARNVANADTPGYRARDVVAFAETYQHGLSSDLRATRAGHFAEAERLGGARLYEVAAGSSPNGNTVSLETEMIRSAEVRHQHDLATSIYKTSLDILRTSIGRGR